MRRSACARLGLALAVALVAHVQPGLHAGAQPSPDVPPLERVIDRHVTVRVPFGSCDIPDTLAVIAKLAELPAGIEHLPGECVRVQDDNDYGNDVPLLGLTVREAVETIAKLDARYMVLESTGTLLVRPVAAWADKDHFLHQEIGRFAVTEVDMHEAIVRLHDAFGKPPRPSHVVQQPRSAAGARLLTVDAGATSLYGALNAIIEAHGALLWEVHYCAPIRLRQAASLTVRTYDGDLRSMLVPSSVPGADGRTAGPCTRR